jgi:hypothetical protein
MEHFVIYATDMYYLPEISSEIYFFNFGYPYPYSSEQGCEDLWLFVEATRGLKAQEFGKH